MNNDVEQLLRAATYGPSGSSSSVVLAVLAPPSEANAQDAPTSTGRSQVSTEPAAMAVELKKLVDAATASQANNVAPSKTSQTTASGDEGPGVGETLLRTAAMMTGVGPIVTGIMKLFGSDDPEPLPALEKFEAPSRVAVEAGLTSDRRYSAIRYSEGGPEAVDKTQSLSGSPTVQVNIQAMDTQSFLDRQDDIARAVREAMLHSNALNDVVMEL